MKKNLWLDVSRVLVHTKYRFKLTEGDKAIYLVDIPKAIEILKENFDISPKNKNMKKERFIWIGIILLLLFGLWFVDNRRNKEFEGQRNQLDSVTLANQRLIQDTNRLGQEVSKQQVITTQNQEALKEFTAKVFNLEKNDANRIKQINALIQIKSRTHVDTTTILYRDGVAEQHFADSIQKICKDVIDFYSSMTVMVPKNVQITEEENKDFQFDGTILKDRFVINSVNLPDSQRIAIIETKGGLFKKDITGKRKFYTPKKLEIQVLHTNKYIKVEGMSSVIYQPKVKGRWLERAIIFAAGGAAMYFLKL